MGETLERRPRVELLHGDGVVGEAEGKARVAVVVAKGTETDAHGLETHLEGREIGTVREGGGGIGAEDVTHAGRRPGLGRGPF